MVGPDGNGGVAGVTAREAEVLRALGQHLTNAEIATRLFISVRTVESHVSSLLRKLHAGDRRALAAVAERTDVAPASASAATRGVVTRLPPSLTPFIGRVAERAALSAELLEHRLVTAVGPGGIGKTRLALSVAAAISDRFPDGVWYVDLVPVSDPARVAPAIAAVLDLGEHVGRSAADSVVHWLAQRETLLVLDNCEHLRDGVVPLLERLLSGSSGLVVLATSRSRLLVPYERVFTVAGLSVHDDESRPGDAVELFLARAASGGPPAPAVDRRRIAALCESLDGIALAIELAAARYASAGLDGLEAGLNDRLQLLTGGARIDDRHRSLRSTLSWSYQLLDEPSRAVLRRVSVFAAPFPAAAAAAVLAGWPPVPARHTASILAGLADSSLLVPIDGSSGTRYRALEIIRQYGADLLDEEGETDQALLRHLRWCLEQSSALQALEQDRAAWRVAFDLVSDELRDALVWASGDPRHHEDASELAQALAHLCFVRGLPGESQRHYEHWAELATDQLVAADAWRGAAGAAEARHFGDEGLRLRLRAAEAALRGGDRAGAAGDLARNAELINRAPGLRATETASGAVEELLARGWELAGDDLTAQARLLVAEACTTSLTAPADAQVVERALALARRVHDPLIESAALDQLTAVQLTQGDVRGALATTLERTELLAPLPVTAVTALELLDGFIMAADCAVAAGHLSAARGLAEGLRDLPFYREEGYLANARLVLVAMLAGEWSYAIALAERFLEGWDRAGRPRAGNLSRGTYAAATLHGLRGDDNARAAWLDVVGALETPGQPLSEVHVGEFFDAWLLLHRGQPEQAAHVLATSPEEFTTWSSGMWRPWYSALWAEAAVLSRSEDTADRIARARMATTGNVIAAAIVDRAAALAPLGARQRQGERWSGDRTRLRDAAAVMQDAGCRYQWARTLIFIGGKDRELGESVLAEIGASPMVWPPTGA